MLIMAILVQLSSVSECRNGADQEIAECWTPVFDQANVQLNKIWPDVLKAASGADKAFAPNQRRGQASAEADLVAAQRSWMKYRDAECALESDYAQGGSLQNIIIGQCETEMTQQRIRQLRDITAGFREG